MPTIGELLNAGTRDALAHLDVPEFCSCTSTSDGFRSTKRGLVHHGCGLVKQVVPDLTSAVGKTVTLACAGGCGHLVTVRVRRAPAEHAGKPRLPVCSDCAITMTADKSGQVYSPTLPVTPATQESHVPQIDLDTMTDAQIGATVRKAVKQDIAEKIPAKQKKAKGKKKAKEKALKAAKQAERRDLTAIGVLPAFTVKGIEIPALDVSDIDSLDDVVPPKVRSPYNKARYRLKQDLLPAGKNPTDPSTTWMMLVNVHQELASAAENVAEAVAEKPKKKARVAAHVDLTEEAKINVLRETFGVSKKKAQRMLAEIGAS